jgi:hypothetical protein
VSEAASMQRVMPCCVAGHATLSVTSCHAWLQLQLPL